MGAANAPGCRFSVKRRSLKTYETYVVCSKSIANFEFARVTCILFSIICGATLVLVSLTCADEFVHFECSVNFWQLFFLDVVRVTFDGTH